MRLALSSTISATFTWREACSSKVDATTSALTLRAISVTSSGRSSISSTIMYTSGWLSAMALAMACSNTVLPVLGCATIRARWPLPMGEKRSTTRVERLLWPFPVRQNFSLGKSGVMNSNCTRSRDVLGRQPVDFVHADQREILLALLRRTDRSVHGVTGLESEKFDLRRRNVDVVGRVQVVVVRRTQESVTVGHDLQHASPSISPANRRPW